MVRRDTLNNIRMFFQQPDVALFMRKKDEFLSTRLRNGEEQFGQQPAELRPIRMGFIKAVKVFIRDKRNFLIFHRFDKIPARVS